jgi:hypothetical protein
MKKINITIIILLFAIGNIVNAQMLSNGLIVNYFPNSSAFLDGSTYNSSTINDGKGLVFPTTDLTTFTFRMDYVDGINFPSAYDGMIIYNITTGKTLPSVGGNNGVVTDVFPGFYYFQNPGQTIDLTNGKWVLIGDLIKNISPTIEVTTSISVEGKKVYATKGTFDTNGTTATTTIVPPAGITEIYRITIYQTKESTDPATLGNKISRRLSSEVYEFNLSSSTNNVTTGKFPFSEVYPIGTYNYTLEYFK